MGKQEEFVLRALEERDIRFVRLWFTDVLGYLKTVAVAPAELEGAFAEGIGFDGSAIEGFARVYESDMLAKPDPSTFQILPWRDEQSRRRARMFCDIVDARRLPVVRRPALRAQAHAVEGRRDGLHLLHPPRDRVLPVQGRAASGRAARAGRPAAATSTTPRRRWDGLPPRGDHHAGGDGHLGGVLPPRGRPRAAGDRPALRRRPVDGRQHHDVPHVVREVALSQGVWASFMPKPFTEHPGSAMHTHVSLFEGDRNAFFEAGAEYQLSKVGRQFIAGLLRHAAEITVVTNQWVNSYKRLLGGAEAPAYVCWGHNNRSAMIRVPDVQAEQGAVDPHRGPLASTPPATPTSPSRSCSPPGSRASRRATSFPPRPRTTSGR